AASGETAPPPGAAPFPSERGPVPASPEIAHFAASCGGRPAETTTAAPLRAATSADRERGGGGSPREAAPPRSPPPPAPQRSPPWPLPGCGRRAPGRDRRFRRPDSPGTDRSAPTDPAAHPPSLPPPA